MRIVQINSVKNGSTGSIMMNIHNELLINGYESYVVWGRGKISNKSNEIYMGDKFGVYLHALFARLSGKNGFFSIKSTYKLLNILDRIKPDIIHLHNIHGYYINIELLFDYIKKNNIKVIWTLHDCWAFTGHCAYFDMVKCSKWKIMCKDCPQKREYPITFFDCSKWCYSQKNRIFNDVKDMILVTPSNWLSKLVKDSFLGKYKVKTINNGIDTNIFKKIKSDFKTQYNIEDKKVILGVAGVWDKRKGLEDFLELSKLIDDNYIIVLIGLTKKQIKLLPDNIIGISRTENQLELVKIYCGSDILFNPTYEDNYPTVNLEAIACGIPVLTYNTGGSCEFLDFVNCNKKNYFIDKDSKKINYSDVLKKIDYILNHDFDFNSNYLIDKKVMIKKYIDLYSSYEVKK